METQDSEGDANSYEDRACSGCDAPAARAVANSARSLIRRRLGWTIGIALVGAGGLEFLARTISLTNVMPYRVTGTLTLLAVLVAGSASVYVIARLRHLTPITQMVSLGAFLLVLAQAMILASYPSGPALAPSLTLISLWAAILNQAFLVLGLALLVGGFFVAILEADRADQRTDLERQSLAKEVEERRRNQAALRESERKFRELVDTLPNAVIVYQEERVTFANAEAAATIRLPAAADLVGTDPFAYVAERDRDRLRSYMTKRLQGAPDIPASYEATLRRAGGEEFPALLYVLTTVFEGKPAIRIVCVEITELKRTEEALRVRSIAIETSITPMVFCGMDGRITSVNPAFARLWGCECDEEAMGRSIMELWHAPDKGARVVEEIIQRENWFGEIVGRRKDGFPIFLHLAASVAKDRNGAPACFMASFVDMTEKKLAEEAMRFSEETLQTIVAANPESLFLIDTMGTIVAANETTARRLGRTTDELIGANVWNLIPWEISESRRRLADEVIRTGRPLRFEDKRDHIHFDSYLQPIFAANGAVVRLAIMAADITARKQMEEELRSLNAELDLRVRERTAELTRANRELQSEIAERKLTEQALKKSEAKYRELVQNANSIILRMDIHGNVTFFNEFAQRFFGYTEEDILGRNVIGTIVPQRDDAGRDLSSMILDIGERPERYASNENENVRRNGEPVWISWTNRPIYNEAGKVAEVLCIGNDITERIRAERIITEQRIKMINAAKMSAVGVLAGSVTHEIKNPLAVISAGTEQLETLWGSGEGAPGTGRLEHVPQILKVVRRNINRIQAIVRGLETLSREGSTDPFTQANVRMILADILELCRERFKSHGIMLMAADITNDVLIECRPSQVSQVLLNLLNNAYEAVVGPASGWVRVEMNDDNESISISITDSSDKPSQKFREKLAHPLFSGKAGADATGLGLVISKSIVESHQGRIELDAQCPNTRFVIRLPKRQGLPLDAAGQAGADSRGVTLS